MKSTSQETCLSSFFWTFNLQRQGTQIIFSANPCYNKICFFFKFHYKFSSKIDHKIVDCILSHTTDALSKEKKKHPFSQKRSKGATL